MEVFVQSRGRRCHRRVAAALSQRLPRLPLVRGLAARPPEPVLVTRTTQFTRVRSSCVMLSRGRSSTAG